MNLYLLKRLDSIDYDDYDSCIVCAIDNDDARTIHPSEFVTHIKESKWMGTYQNGGEYECSDYGWPNHDEYDCIEITLLGIADSNVKRGCIIGSYNAG